MLFIWRVQSNYLLELIIALLPPSQSTEFVFNFSTFTNCCMLLQSVSSKVYQSYAFSLALFCLPAWVGGFIAISIISFLSLLGVILVPLMNRVFFKFLLSFLVALAVGTLSGDAFLHLLPHVSMVICPISVFYLTLKIYFLVGTRIFCIDV